MKNVISKFFDYDGKIGRFQFLGRSIAIYILIGITYSTNKIIQDLFVEKAKEGYLIKTTWFTIYGLGMGIILLILISSLLILQIKRLDDLNRSRWLTILTFIPPLNMVYYLYLVLAKSQNSIGQAYNNEVTEVTCYNDVLFNKDENTSMNVQTDIQDKKEIDRRKESKKKAIIIVAVLVLLLILGSGYFNLFYSPYNGVWEGELPNKLVKIEINDGEGRLIIYKNKIGTGVAQNIYDLRIFDKNSKSTLMGIGGKSHKLKVNRNILLVELNNLNSESGKLDRDIYLKRIKR